MTNVFLPTIKDVKGDTPWSASEQDLLNECRLGREAYLPGREDRPQDTSDPDRRVRAGLVRYLMLGGGKGKGAYRPHPKGVMLRGAWIDGALDLAGCQTRLDLGLHHCLFPDPITLRDAGIGALYLPGSHARKAVDLHRLKVETSVHLRKGFSAIQGVNLGSAQIGGVLDCVDGTFRNSGGQAINAQAAQIGGSVFLCGQDFLAEGEVNLRGASITGQLVCVNGTFRNPNGRAIDAEASQIGADVFWGAAKVDGDLDFRRSTVAGDIHVQGLQLDGSVTFRGAKVAGALNWQGVSGAVPVFDLMDAAVSVLRDNRGSWDLVTTVRLGGFRYDQLDDPISAAFRLEWLAKSPVSTVERVERGITLLPNDPPGFDPRPFTQLAKVLREDGHTSAAALVLETRQDQLRRSEFDRSRARLRYGSGGDATLLRASTRF